MRFHPVWWVLGALTLGCAGSAPPPSAPAPGADEPTPPAAEPAGAASAAAIPFGFAPRMVALEPADEAPAGLATFGRLVGRWLCTSEQRQPDGGWHPGPGSATWSFFYTLDGQAVQDVWEGANGGIGTNLRVFDPETGDWHVAWATTGLAAIDRWVARAEGEAIVMRSEQPARPPRGPHLAKITFHAIAADAFQWRYEASPIGDGETWTAFSRIACARAPAP